MLSLRPTGRLANRELSKGSAGRVTIARRRRSFAMLVVRKHGMPAFLARTEIEKALSGSCSVGESFLARRSRSLAGTRTRPGIVTESTGDSSTEQPVSLREKLWTFSSSSSGSSDFSVGADFIGRSGRRGLTAHARQSPRHGELLSMF